MYLIEKLRNTLLTLNPSTYYHSYILTSIAVFSKCKGLALYTCTGYHKLLGTVNSAIMHIGRLFLKAPVPLVLLLVTTTRV